MSYSSAARCVARAARTGSPAALPMGGRKPFTLAGEGEWVRDRLAEKHDMTGRELLAELRARKVRVSYYAVWHVLDHAGLSFKNQPACQRAGLPRRGAAPGAVAAALGQC